jgi:ornithine cyclodeaminase
MFILGERDVRKALDPLQCLEITKTALVSLVDKTGVVPSRLALPYPTNPNREILKSDGPRNIARDWTLIKPAAYYRTLGDHQDDCNGMMDSEDVIMGLKVVSIRANNPSQGLPLVPATILLMDAQSGLVQAMLAGTYITAMRTSAGPALAVQAFQPNVQSLVIFGAGTQAECHIQLIELALGRSIPKITIINRTLERAKQLQNKIENQRDRKGSVASVALDDKPAVADALSTADVISATTNTTTPLWSDGDDNDDNNNIVLKEGCLITGIGSYTPDMQEIPPTVVNQSAVIIDTLEALQVGDLKHLGGPSLEEVSCKHPVTLAGNALQNPERFVQLQQYSQKRFVFFKAVGTAIQDVLQAKAVMNKAKELGLGHEIDMT